MPGRVVASIRRLWLHIRILVQRRGFSRRAVARSSRLLLLLSAVMLLLLLLLAVRVRRIVTPQTADRRHAKCQHLLERALE